MDMYKQDLALNNPPGLISYKILLNQTNPNYVQTMSFGSFKNNATYKLFAEKKYIYIYIYIQGSLNKFPGFFYMGTFIDSTHMKL